MTKETENSGNTKMMPCKYPKCGERRIHFERQDVSRKTQYVEVPDNATEFDPIFCSIECALLDGWISINCDGPEDQQTQWDKWRKMNASRMCKIL